MKTLCLYYSRTNMTKTAMKLLAGTIGADIFEYTDGRDRSGAAGYLGACIDSFRRTLPKVTIKGAPDLGAYDRAVIGMPLWVESPCVVGRALLQQYGPQLPQDVCLVVTHMAGADYMKKILALDDLLGRPAVGHLSLRTKNNDYLREIKAFAATL